MSTTEPHPAHRSQRSWCCSRKLGILHDGHIFLLEADPFDRPTNLTFLPRAAFVDLPGESGDALTINDLAAPAHASIDAFNPSSLLTTRDPSILVHDGHTIYPEQQLDCVHVLWHPRCQSLSIEASWSPPALSIHSIAPSGYLHHKQLPLMSSHSWRPRDLHRNICNNSTVSLASIPGDEKVRLQATGLLSSSLTRRTAISHWLPSGWEKPRQRL